MASELIDEGDENITNTWVGREFGYDRKSEVNWAMLRQVLASARNVLANPENFPQADITALEETVFELEMFLLRAPIKNASRLTPTGASDG